MFPRPEPGQEKRKGSVMTDSPQLKNTVQAWLLAPLAPIFIIIILANLSSPTPYSLSGFIFLAGCMIGYPAITLFFIPLHLLLAKRKITGYRHYILAGVVSGLLLFLSLFFLTSHSLISQQPNSILILILAYTVFICLIGALTFRFVAVWKTDRQSEDSKTE